VLVFLMQIYLFFLTDLCPSRTKPIF